MKPFLKYRVKNLLIVVCWSCLTLVTPVICFGHSKTDSTKKQEQKILNITEHLLVFYPLEQNAKYSVTICADLPDNNNPSRVYKKKEPGHVFLILKKEEPSIGSTITASFGFYPTVPVTCLFKKVKSRIMDNSNREYNASLVKNLTSEEFILVLNKCNELSKRKYDLKKFNCYEYALEVFNSIPGIEKLPVSDVKFPFILGRGGSPCGLYKDLQNLVTAGSQWAPDIRFGVFQSPPHQINAIASIKR